MNAAAASCNAINIQLYNFTIDKLLLQNSMGITFVLLLIAPAVEIKSHTAERTAGAYLNTGPVSRIHKSSIG